MTRREKCLAALRRRSGEYLPFEFELCPALEEEFARRTGSGDYREYYDFPVRRLTARFVGDAGGRYSRYYPDTDNLTVNDWGVGFRKGALAHFAEIVSPLKDCDDMAALRAFPLPDPDRDYDWEGFARAAADCRRRDLLAVARMGQTIFEMAWHIRGMEEFLMDMLSGEEVAEYLIGEIAARRRRMAERYVAAGADVLWLGDDVSTQLDMMMSPEVWRRLLKPALASVIAAARRLDPDLLIFYHGDGNLEKIIPDLVEIGVNILNPVQPECLDPFAVKERYGDSLTIWGAIGTQTTMPFGAPDEVYAACREAAARLGRGGGYVLCPTHMLEPEVPWANIEALLAAAADYNAGK